MLRVLVVYLHHPITVFAFCILYELLMQLIRFPGSVFEFGELGSILPMLYSLLVDQDHRQKLHDLDILLDLDGATQNVMCGTNLLLHEIGPSKDFHG